MSQDMTQHHFSPETHQQSVACSGDHMSKPTLEEASQIEKDKQLIKSHPLFVLLELLFDKCEQATNGEEIPSSAAYDGEIQAFVRKHEESLSPIFIDNVEIDNLMVKAIQVLRIHLLELEKVNELCKDFCTRYITCLKGKMHSENLLRSDMSAFNDATAHLMHNTHPNQIASTPNSNIAVNQQGEFVRHESSLYQSNLRDEQAIPVDNGIDGSTPLSQVGVSSPPTHAHYPSQQHIFMHSQQHMQGMSDDSHSKKTAKRGVLPKHATETLRSWLFSHIVHPYPTEDEKRSLATQTNLTLLQVNNWFINARRRILQPMLDASNHEVGGSKSKKPKMQNNRSTDRFWPNSITSSSGPGPHAEEAESSLTSMPHNPSSTGQQQQAINEQCQPPQMAIEGFPEPSSSELDQQQLRHYHSDVAVTAHGQASLNMVKN